MTVDVLITASIVYTGKRVLRNGYVYIRGGRVVDVGEGPVPEDYTYATLILGGEGRIVAPGLAAYVDAPAYPIRGLRPSLAERARFYERLDAGSLALLSLPAIYEAHMAGVTTVVVEAPTSRLASDLEEGVGGYYVAAVPTCVADRGEARVKVGGDGCPEDGAEIIVSGGTVRVGGAEVPGSASALSLRAAITRVRGVHEGSLRLRERLGIPGGVIEKDARAEVVVYDARKPPALLVDLYDLPLDELYRLGATVESLVAGDEVLVDGGEHLRITDKHFGDVMRLASSLLRRGR